jgi:mono/diheme cytochrome c family protein
MPDGALSELDYPRRPMNPLAAPERRGRTLALAACLSTSVLLPLAARSAVLNRVSSPQDAVGSSVASQDQTERGKAAYAQSCTPCHKSNLSGDQSAPALVGDTFTARWTNQSVGDLFDNIRTGMPMDNPGGLDDATYVDIVAYILRQNSYSIAMEELRADRDALKKLTIAK